LVFCAVPHRVPRALHYRRAEKGRNGWWWYRSDREYHEEYCGYYWYHEYYEYYEYYGWYHEYYGWYHEYGWYHHRCSEYH
jgi:hypothetical protein|tara:strand:- start:1675 stop:1914 length:240 start_codon:yes stop_codon:yes gene_type:complete